jgi:hypothetical protein
MGVDFMLKKAAAHQKGWDRAAVDLRTRNLFTKEPDRVVRCVNARPLGARQFVEGEKLIVVAQDNHLIALDGNDPVAECDDPSPSTLDAIGASYVSGVVLRTPGPGELLEVELC